MKVLVVTNAFPKFSETFIRDQIIQLIDSNIKVIIFTRHIDSLEIDCLKGFDEYKLMEKIYTLNTIQPDKLKTRIFKCLLIIVKSIFNKFFVKFIKVVFSKTGKGFRERIHDVFLLDFLINNRVNVIHAHFGNNGDRFSVFEKCGFKLVTTFHGYDIRATLKKGSSAYPNLFKSNSSLIAISDYNYNSLASLQVDSNRLVRIANGVNTDFFEKKDYLESRSLIRLITVARLVQEKAIHIAIEAVHLLIDTYPDIRLEYNIIGEGELKKDLREQITSLSLDNHIKLLGVKDSFEVKNWLLESDILLLSSTSEALPTVILEAQSCGIPVLATDVGSVTSMVKGGLVVEAGNVIAFFEGLKTLVKNRGDWSNFGALGREYVVKEHSIQRQIASLIQVYKNI